MVDPDAPRADRPKMRWWRHWLLTDIPVRASLSVCLLQALSLYRQPAWL